MRVLSRLSPGFPPSQFTAPLPVTAGTPQHFRDSPIPFSFLSRAPFPGQSPLGMCPAEGSVPTPVLAAAIGPFTAVAKPFSCSDRDSKESTIQIPHWGRGRKTTPGMDLSPGLTDLVTPWGTLGHLRAFPCFPSPKLKCLKTLDSHNPSLSPGSIQQFQLLKLGCLSWFLFNCTGNSLVGVGRDLKAHPFPPLPRAETLSTVPGSPSSIQPVLGIFQGSRGSHGCSGKSIQGLTTLIGKNFLPKIESKSSLFQPKAGKLPCLCIY